MGADEACWVANQAADVVEDVCGFRGGPTDGEAWIKGDGITIEDGACERLDGRLLCR